MKRLSPEDVPVATVDVAAQIKLADDGKTVWALPNSGTTVFIR